MKSALLLCAVFAAVTAYENPDIISARIESCRGCSLNRLPEVKKFIMEDAPFYERLEVKFINGAPPELILLGEGDRELERMPLSQLGRQECNDALLNRGFNKKSKKSEL